MKLYKFTTSLEVAESISRGVFRFYELVKYIQVEDGVGRSDLNEGGICFTDDECVQSPEKVPMGSLNGVEFKVQRMALSEEYIEQYFVFCMSTGMNENAIGDASHVVELNKDIFETFELLLVDEKNEGVSVENTKVFTHALVEYYDINKHPRPFGVEKWREIYLKRSEFTYQKEYRAAFFATSPIFEEIKCKPVTLKLPIYDADGGRMPFDLKLHISAAVDSDGWRYFEFDLSEFSDKLTKEASTITEVSKLELQKTEPA